MNFLLCFLVWAARSTIYYKISTLTPNVLTPNDYLTSAMGGFRLTLTTERCQLQIQKFQKNNYVVVGYFPRAALAPCSNLTISNNSLVSSSGNMLLSLRSGQRNAKFDQVFVTIDENSIVRISGIYFNQYQTSQNWISIFRAPQQFLYSISNLSVTRFNSLSFIQNLGNWGFSATNGELRIFRIDNSTKIVRYNYTAFTMTPGNLFDYNSNSLPYADFRDFQYKSKCINSQNFAFQGPFTFSINPYWPELRLIDQNGYEIISIRYPSINCTAIGLDHTRQTTNCLSWFCPQNMFEHQGSCVPTCPLPYFHQLDQDNIHRCVLNCRADFQKDIQIRVCSCTTPKLYQCPPELQATPLGCLCPNKTFFNPTNKATNNPSLCQPDCGPAFISHVSGLCLPCPKNCIECSLSSTSFNYLKCSACEEGFQLNSEGYCVRQCRLSPGKVLVNNTCTDCGVPFCRNCSEGVSNCSACYIPYSLLLNTCVDSCPSGYRTVFRSDQTFECKLISNCPSQLVQVGSVNNQSQCFCLRNNRLPARTTFNQCGQQSPSCLYDQYYDSNTKECLSCPASCLTCGLDGSNRIECTSCRPDYTMFVTLAKNHYCERNSILSFCPSNYNREEQICALSNLRNLVANLSNRNMCFPTIKNCMICILGSNRSCSLCQQGFYLHQGQCLKQCPNTTYPYAFQRVCVKKMVQNCLKERQESLFWQFRKDNANQNADALLILLSVNFQLIDPLNDPIGSLFTYSARSSVRSQFAARMVNIAYSYSQCVVCKEGYGISSNGSCSPCLSPCVLCMISSGNVTSCIKCDQYHRLVNSSCIQLDPTQMPCERGQFRNQKLFCQNNCLNFYRPNNFYLQSKNKAFEVNCTLNCPSQFAITLNRSSPLVSCEANNKEDTSINLIKLFASRMTINNQNIYAFISSHRIINRTKDMIKVSILDRNQRILQTAANSQLQIFTTDFGFLIVDNSTKNENKLLVIELSTAQMRAEDGSSLLGNSIYGYHRDVKPPIDIIYQQTSNLYMYGRAFTILLFLATVIFAGMRLNYKTDNIFIIFTTVYLVLTALNLSPSASTFNCYSFLYGFSWSSYLQMLSNPRDLSQNSGWFDDYLDQANNNAHYILFVDNNIIRNCWSILLFLIIATGILGLAVILFKCFSVKRNSYGLRCGSTFIQSIFYQWKGVGYSSQDFDHTTSALIILIFFIQNSFMALTYYSFINIFNKSWEMASSNKLTSFKVVSWIFFVFMLFYSTLRVYGNRIAGIYCFKRIAIGIILGIASVKGGIDDNIIFTIIMLIVQQLIFLGLRYRYQLVSDKVNQLATKQLKLQPKQAMKTKISSRKTLPEHNILKATQNAQLSEGLAVQLAIEDSEKQKWIYMLVEEGIIMVLYIFLVLVNVLKEGSLTVIWLIILFFMGVVALQVFEASLKAWEAAIVLQMHKSKQQPSYIKHIRNVYDHEMSLKSLAETTDN